MLGPTCRQAACADEFAFDFDQQKKLDGAKDQRNQPIFSSLGVSVSRHKNRHKKM